jgi:hypothetical protein
LGVRTRLAFGGSNDIANLYPEKANANPCYDVKDNLENKQHDLDCDGMMTLRSVQREIAANWRALYKRTCLESCRAGSYPNAECRDYPGWHRRTNMDNLDTGRGRPLFSG